MRPPSTRTRAPARHALVVVIVLALAGCGVSGAAPTPPDGSPRASATVSPSPTATGLAALPPLPQVVDVWSTAANASARLAHFVNLLDAASRYRVDREDRVDIAGEFRATRVAHIVDEAEARVLSTQTFEVSDDATWSELTQDPELFEFLLTHELQAVTDYAHRKPRMYMTYLGDDGWDGQWLDTTAGDPAGGAGAAALRGSTPEVHAQGFLEVVALEAVGFAEHTRVLEYDVPARIAAGFLPPGTSAALHDLGIDPFSLAATARAHVYAVTGGVEMSIEVAWLLREAGDMVEDQVMAQYLGTVGVPVTIRIHDLDTEEPIDLPDPAMIVTDLPATWPSGASA